MFVLSYFIQVLLSEVPRYYRSCLLSQGNISRLTLCLVPIELKLRRFRKPTFIGFEIRCELQVSQEYLTSISQASIYRLELSVWVTPHTERVIALLLSLISRQHGNNNRTVNNTGQGSAVTTILSKPRIIFHVCEGDFGI